MKLFLSNASRIFIFISFFVLLDILPAHAEKRVAVLPFEVISTNQEMSQFGIGTMDTITHALGSFQELIMIDRGQLKYVMKELSFQQSGFVKGEQANKIGEMLGADLLILGSIQNFKDKFRISAHFTEVKSGKIIKSVQVTGNDIFDLQDQLANEIIKTQEIKPSKEQIAAISKITKATNDISAYEYYIKGRSSYLLFSEKGYREAIQMYDKALEKDQNYCLALSAKSEAQINLANELKYWGLPFEELQKQSKENAIKALSLEPNLTETHRALSMFYSMSLKFDESKKEAEIALKLNPNDAESMILLWASKLPKNKEPLNPKDPLIVRALEINPRLILTHALLAMTYISTFNLEKAFEEGNIILKINPDYFYAHIILGSVYISQGNSDKAFEELKKAEKISPGNVTSKITMASLYLSQNKYSEAEKELKAAIKIYPKLPDAYFLLGVIDFAQEKYFEAENDVNKAIEIFPQFGDNEHTNYFLAQINKKLLRNDQALTYLKKALEINPETMGTHALYGQIFQEKGNFVEAIINYKRAIEIDKEHNKSIKNLVECYLAFGSNFYKNGNIEKAEENYQEAFKLNPEEPRVNLNLGVIFHTKRKYEQAIEKYNKVLKVSPENAEAHYNLGITFTELGKNNLANEEFKKACHYGLKSSCQ